jgi:NADPH:quinone reductase-like Zn-dependent oxidoreductase
MRAVTIVDQSLQLVEHPDPEPGPGEVVLAVRAAGLNPADALQRRGFYPAPPGAPVDIPGLEAAGEVIAVGPGTTRFAVGDRAMVLVGGGAQAERLVAHESSALAVPDHVGWEAAGGFCEVFTTAHDALFTQAGLGLGERVCIHGAAGGVGTAAIQLAHAAGAFVVATVRDQARHDAVRDLGADVVAGPEGFGDHGPFDVVLELLGGANLPDDVAALAPGGRIVVIGVSRGSRAEVDLLGLMNSRGRILGSTLRSRPLEGRAAAVQAVGRHVLPLLAAGRIHVPVTAAYPLADATAAYERLAAPGKLGKVVLVADA